ncbi:MAG: hypothetical protein J0I79_16465 [Mesorhizobium sp.]|uniref:hypothetical protein n=1 Tax=Mesorhizobium sp. TaxID=1871066 RepID=UPI001ACB72B7|nr:hypothetical protein [Mesorhizobium sp.]MBN9219540.1 hypothetical protein [Mesorhizobium sp.]
MLELRSLPREQVMPAWPDIAPILARVVGKDGREDLLDVAGGLLKGEYQAYIIVDGPRPVAVAVTQILQTRHEKLGCIVYVAGDGLTDWLGFIDSVCEWCKAQGCTSVEGTGRKGWERILKSRDFDRVTSTIRKRL